MKHNIISEAMDMAEKSRFAVYVPYIGGMVGGALAAGGTAVIAAVILAKLSRPHELFLPAAIAAAFVGGAVGSVIAGRMGVRAVGRLIPAAVLCLVSLIGAILNGNTAVCCLPALALLAGGVAFAGFKRKPASCKKRRRKK